MILLFGFAKIKFLLYSVKKKLARQIIFSTPIFVRHSREFVNIYVVKKSFGFKIILFIMTLQGPGFIVTVIVTYSRVRLSLTVNEFDFKYVQ